MSENDKPTNWADGTIARLQKMQELVSRFLRERPDEEVFQVSQESLCEAIQAMVAAREYTEEQLGGDKGRRLMITAYNSLLYRIKSSLLSVQRANDPGGDECDATADGTVKIDSGLIYLAVCRTGALVEQCYVNRYNGQVACCISEARLSAQQLSAEDKSCIKEDQKKIKESPWNWVEIPPYTGPIGGEAAFIRQFLRENEIDAELV